MKLQKHEREGVLAIERVARRENCQARLIRRGSHSATVILTKVGVAGRQTIKLPSSPGDPVWAVRVAAAQAKKACRKLKGA